MINHLSDEIIRKILIEAKIIAIVGLSPNPERPSHRVGKYLLERGYRVIPVNPNVDEVLRQKAFPTLLKVPYQIDIVDIFRRISELPQIVDEAIELEIPTIWMQEGLIYEPAYSLGKKIGINVVMDRCLMAEHKRLIGRKKDEI